MARYNRYQLEEYHTYAANTTTVVNLPENGYITDIHCCLESSITPHAVTVSPRTDGIINLVESSRISAAGQTYFTVTAAEDWYYWNFFRYRGQIRLTALPAAGAAATSVYADLPIHLGYYPKEPFDPTVVLPGRRISNLQHAVTWNAAADLGTGYTVGTTTMKLIISEIVLEHGESEEDVWPDGILVPRVENTSESLTTAHSRLALAHTVPVDLVLHHTLITILDENGDRTNTPVTELGVRLPPLTEEPMFMHWYEALGENMRRTETAGLTLRKTVTAGEYFLEWPLISGNERGIDLTGAKSGDVTINFTNSAAASETARMLHIGYLRPTLR